LQRISATAPGVIGISVVDLGSGHRYGINYGSDGMDATIREISSVIYRYFAQIARTTPYGDEGAPRVHQERPLST